LNQTIAVTNATTHAQNNLAQSSPRTLSPPPVKSIFYFIEKSMVLFNSIDRIREIKKQIKRMKGKLERNIDLIQ
jgi:hypothetical protein